MPLPRLNPAWAGRSRFADAWPKSGCQRVYNVHNSRRWTRGVEEEAFGRIATIWTRQHNLRSVP